MATTVVATDISTKSIRITITAKFEHKRRWCVSVTVQKGKKGFKILCNNIKWSLISFWFSIFFWFITCSLFQSCKTYNITTIPYVGSDSSVFLKNIFFKTTQILDQACDQEVPTFWYHNIDSKTNGSHQQSSHHSVSPAYLFQ